MVTDDAGGGGGGVVRPAWGSQLQGRAGRIGHPQCLELSVSAGSSLGRVVRAEGGGEAAGRWRAWSHTWAQF